MRGTVETTIPQRQYENIKTSYHFEDSLERNEAIAQAIEDCITLKDIVAFRIKQTAPPSLKPGTVIPVDSGEMILSDVVWKKVDGFWQYLENGVWKRSQTPPEAPEKPVA